MRREPEFFEDRELSLLFMARRLRHALELEDLLTKSRIDYCIETGQYIGGLLFRRELTGAYFYVDPGDLVKSRELLTKNGFKPFDPERNR
jgi:hypothetical protein